MEGQIKNIIFDLGGVLYDIDYTRTIGAMEKIGVKDFDKIFTQKNQSDLFNRLEEGKITADDFTKELSIISGVALNTKDVEWALNTMLFNIPTHRLELVNALRKKYRVFLYSNINEVHAAEIHRVIMETHGISDFNQHFEKVYYSHEMGIRKPNAEGFLTIVNEQKLNPQETLFIDDSPQHVEGAKRAGLQAVWLDLKQNDIHQLIEKMGL
ncbi:MAG: HAD family phosphatase [Bacteroidetes bacterium]|nr:HAD family phosphatase [Bacteroidota bacterium]